MSTSFRKLVNEKCKQCTYDPLGEGNWRQQTGACTVASCPLWPVRPQSNPRGSGRKAHQTEVGGAD